MKKIIFSALVLVTATLFSCRKEQTYQDIKQYDEQQIQNYIENNGITGMQRDTSGIYYKILKPGAGSELQYDERVSLVFTLHTFDGRYASTDTISNRYGGFLGRVSTSGYPLALQKAIFEIVKRKGTQVRLLIPSNLGYGANGVGSGSSTTNNTRIYGNQCLDYYINVVNDQPGDNQDTYDDMLITNYLTAQGLTGFQKTASGLYYLITRPGVGTEPITDNSTVYCTYTFRILNGFIFDSFNGTTSGTPLEVPELIPGIKEGFKSFGTVGTKMTLIMPSSLAYGNTTSAYSIPANSVARFDVQILNIIP